MTPIIITLICLVSFLIISYSYKKEIEAVEDITVLREWMLMHTVINQIVIASFFFVSALAYPMNYLLYSVLLFTAAYNMYIKGRLTLKKVWFDLQTVTSNWKKIVIKGKILK